MCVYSFQAYAECLQNAPFINGTLKKQYHTAIYSFVHNLIELEINSLKYAIKILEHKIYICIYNIYMYVCVCLCIYVCVYVYIPLS